jgi:uncharacterized coiled-coil DUF342 family protein
MAAKKTNGHDPNTAEMVGLLRELVQEVRATNARIDQTNARLDQTNAEVRELRGEIREVRDDVRAFKVDTVRAFIALNHDITDIGEEIRGGPRGTLRARVERLEDAVFKRAG